MCELFGLSASQRVAGSALPRAEFQARGGAPAGHLPCRRAGGPDIDQSPDTRHGARRGVRSEHGIYPAGTYIKSPPGSMHAPRSPTGCTLFCRVRHLDGRDLVQVVVRPLDRHWHRGLVSGLEVLPLDQFGATHAALVRWAPGTGFRKHQHFGGEEIFVLEGTFQDEYGRYPIGTWIRNPHMSSHQPYSDSGCQIFVKALHQRVRHQEVLSVDRGLADSHRD